MDRALVVVFQQPAASQMQIRLTVRTSSVVNAIVSELLIARRDRVYSLSALDWVRVVGSADFDRL